MRIRTGLVGVAALVVVVAFLLYQTPMQASSPYVPSLASGQLNGAVVSDTSYQDGAADLTGFPVGVVLVASEYLRKARSGAAESQIFTRAPISESAQRRDQVMIMMDILAFAHRPVSRKQILLSLNMSQYQLKRYLRFLMLKGFVLEELKQPRTYKVTEKGSEFLKLLQG